MSHDLPWAAGVVQRKLRTTVGKRFGRFVLVAAGALLASQISLTLLLGVAHVSSGASGIAAAIVGAGVSYVLSRWAWERKGRPHLLRETLPFWLVSVGAWIVLGATTHFSSLWAHSMGLGHWERVAFVDGAYFVANCVTFVSRFLIFHYVLFADRGPKAIPTPGPARVPGSVPSTGTGQAGSGAFAASGSVARVSAQAWESTVAERSPAGRPEAGAGVLPEPGSRR